MTQYLITALIDFFVGFLAISKKGNRAAVALSFTVFSLGLWSLELFFLTTIQDVSVLSTWFHLARWGMFFIPVASSLLTFRLLGDAPKGFLYFVVFPSFIVGLSLSVLNLFVFPSSLKATDSGFLPEVDSIYLVFAATFLYCMCASIVLCLACYRTITTRQKHRVRWLFITLFVAFLSGGVSILLMPYDFYLSKYIGASSNIAIVLLLFYSTVQHHLMDFRLAISEGVTRALLLGFFVWFYFFVTSFLGDLEKNVEGVLVTLIFIVGVLELYPRMLKWILPNAKKLLNKDAYNFDGVIHDTAKALNEVASVYSLEKLLNHLLLQVLRVKYYSLELVDIEGGCSSPRGVSIRTEDDRKAIANYCTDLGGLIVADETPESIRNILFSYKSKLCFSVMHDKRILAVVLMGAPIDLQYYRYDDIQVFEWLQKELGQVLNRINQLDEMQDELGQAKKTLSMLGLMNHYHHDIKAPFAIIDGVLSNNIYDREKQKDIVLEQVERGSRLIATMADILKGQRKRKIQPLSINQTVEDSLFVFSGGIDAINSDFGDIPQINGDAEDLKILIINVVKNAVEARKGDGDLELNIRTWISHEFVCLAIADNGVGMSELQLTDLWVSGRSSKANGNGIGLQAIKRIADEHRALIDVESSESSGTEFVVKFPLSLVVDVDDANIESPEQDTIFTKNKVKKEEKIPGRKSHDSF